MPTNKTGYMADWRSKNPQHKERNAKLGKARDQALMRLKELYPIDYEILLAEERRKLGI